MYDQPYYTIGDKQFSREELLTFGRQHYPKFYWIKRGIGIGLLSIGLLYFVICISVLAAYGFPGGEDAVGMYIGLFITPIIFSLAGAVLFSISFISLPDDSYIKHALDYYYKVDRNEKRYAQRVEQRTNKVNRVENNQNIDQLLKYKELLDSGAITQEEFEQKKKELL
ncbi:MAG: SHOCT domain-containing protein [Bacilli bacterium]|nr:SHOCT domain-containing protein [Bacilli bacterium]